MTYEEALRGCDKFFVAGVDPGPVSSAIVLVRFIKGVPDIKMALYADNAGFDDDDKFRALFNVGLCGAGEGKPLFLAYEAVGAQGKFVGETTFETAAMGGEIRRAFRPYADATYRMVSSDWRHALTGQGNAKTPLVYHEICRLFEPTGAGADPYKGTKDKPGPLWNFHAAGKGGNVEHLKDALGVALGLTRVRFRGNRDPEIYRRQN